MKPKGLFVTIKEKDEVIEMFKKIRKKYENPNPSSIRQRVLICKSYCRDVSDAINNCFAAEMWGPRQYLQKLNDYMKNDNINNIQVIVYDVSNIIISLLDIVRKAVPISELPSCKHVAELSVNDAVSAVNDLGKNKIVNTTICAILLGKNIADRIEISDIENYYLDNYNQLVKEIREKNETISGTEAFLMMKFEAELAYCQQARVKTGLGIVKEISGIVGNISEIIEKYEKVSNSETRSLSN